MTGQHSPAGRARLPHLRRLRRLVDPVGVTPSSQGYLRVHFLSVLLLLLLVIDLFGAVLPGLLDPAAEPPLWLALVILGLLAAGYWLNRRGYSGLAAAGLVTIPGGAIYVTALLQTHPANFQYLVYMVLPVLLASIFISIGQTVLLIVLMLVGVGVFPLLQPLADPLQLPSLFLAITAAFIVLMTIYRYALERQLAERGAELDRERAQLKAILDAMGEGVIYNEDDQVRYVNHALVTMTGYDETRLLGGSLESLVCSREATPRSLRSEVSPATGRLVFREEVRLRRKGGALDAALTITMLDAPGQRPRREVILIRDISKEKALQQQKDRFIANASHELRTPISNMKLYLYLLDKSPHKMGEYMPTLHKVTDRMKVLVDDLLDLSRLQRGVITLQLATVPLQTLVEEALSLQTEHARQKSLALTAHLPADSLPVLIDEQRMMQVILNLVVNAINYTPEGGSIRLTLDAETDSSRARWVVLRVIDDGVGIAPEALANLFTPFYRASEDGEGAGLGLTISKEIVDLHNGSITVESVLGQGTTFAIRLPLMAN